MMAESNEDHKFEQVVQQIAPQSRLLRTWRLNGGISAEMTALEIEDPRGLVRKLIIRRPGKATLNQNRQAAYTEYRLLQMLRPHGLAAPAPCFLDISGKIFPAPYLVIDYIEGRPEFSPTDVASYTRQMAAYLARLHGLDCATLDLSFLPGLPEGLTAAFGERPVKPDQSLYEDCIRDALESTWPFPRRNRPALLHGDFWPGNLLWRDGQLAAVIDWEDAKTGDPLTDLAISRLDILWIFGREAMDSFTQHYLSLISLDNSWLPYWDLAAALRLVHLAGSNLAEWTAFFQPFGRGDITEQTIRNYYRFFVTQAFEKLEVFI